MYLWYYFGISQAHLAYSVCSKLPLRPLLAISMPITHAHSSREKDSESSAHLTLPRPRRRNSERNPKRNNGGLKSQFTQIAWTVRFVFDFGLKRELWKK